jgi:hypothetical protein
MEEEEKEKKIAISNLLLVPVKFPNFNFGPCKIPEF